MFFFFSIILIKKNVSNFCIFSEDKINFNIKKFSPSNFLRGVLDTSLDAKLQMYGQAQFGLKLDSSSSSTAENTFKSIYGELYYPKGGVRFGDLNLKVKSEVISYFKDNEVVTKGKMEEFFSIYGHFVIMKFSYGGKLVMSSEIKTDFLNSKEAKSIESKVQASFEQKLYSLTGGINTQNKNEVAKINSEFCQNSRIDLIGGDEKFKSDPEKWYDSLANPDTWKIISIDATLSTYHFLPSRIRDQFLDLIISASNTALAGSYNEHFIKPKVKGLIRWLPGGVCKGAFYDYVKLDVESKQKTFHKNFIDLDGCGVWTCKQISRHHEDILIIDENRHFINFCPDWLHYFDLQSAKKNEYFPDKKIYAILGDGIFLAFDWKQNCMGIWKRLDNVFTKFTKNVGIAVAGFVTNKKHVFLVMDREIRRFKLDKSNDLYDDESILGLTFDASERDLINCYVWNDVCIYIRYGDKCFLYNMLTNNLKSTSKDPLNLVKKANYWVVSTKWKEKDFYWVRLEDFHSILYLNEGSGDECQVVGSYDLSEDLRR